MMAPALTATERINIEYDQMLRCGVARATKMLAAEQIIGRRLADISRLEELLAEATAENLENCRLLGISASKETALLAKIEKFKQVLRIYGTPEVLINAVELGYFSGKDL